MGTLRHSQLRRDAKILLIGANARIPKCGCQFDLPGSRLMSCPRQFLHALIIRLGGQRRKFALRRRLLAAGVLPSVALTAKTAPQFPLAVRRQRLDLFSCVPLTSVIRLS